MTLVRINAIDFYCCAILFYVYKNTVLTAQLSKAKIPP